MSQYDAYTRNIKATAAPRDVEYRLLAQVTAALLNARDLSAERRRSDPRVTAQFMEAINWNNQVWDAFVEDVGTEGNVLPRELRAAIVSLGIWVTRETALIAEDKGDLDALISVNRAIMKGLNPNAPVTADANSETELRPAAVGGETSSQTFDGI
ncbi:MAG: flagellar biosynthesis regulator FlaF [Alphaproteobacteria bacterium]|nr:flagellar biosynthesis regulator FlaF [Alphaproteobacteria bacterium]